jgi:hypothetical protein
MDSNHSKIRRVIEGREGGNCDCGGVHVGGFDSAGELGALVSASEAVILAPGPDVIAGAATAAAVVGTGTSCVLTEVDAPCPEMLLPPAAPLFDVSAIETTGLREEPFVDRSFGGLSRYSSTFGTSWCCCASTATNQITSAGRGGTSFEDR